MIDFYTFGTPNGHKVSIALEEMGTVYATHVVDIRNGGQFDPAFVAISPNSRIPAIVDQDGDDGSVSLFESGAILIYLAEKSGQFLAASGRARAKTLEWLMWQMGGVGPMLGQANHFANTAEEKIPYAIDRYITESARLLRVLDDRLAKVAFVAGDYSIADMALYPWVKVGFEVIRSAKPDVVGGGENVARWLASIGERPAVQRGMAVPA